MITAMRGIRLYNCDNLELLAKTSDNSLDIILVDPPYMYLCEKLDRAFDMERFYSECYRVLNKDYGVLVVFGRGVSFYKTCGILSDLGLWRR